MKTVQEVIIEQTINPTSESVAIIKQAICTPTLLLSNGARIVSEKDGCYKVYSPENKVLSAGMFTKLEQLFLSMIIERDIVIMEKCGIKIPKGVNENE